MQEMLVKFIEFFKKFPLNTGQWFVPPQGPVGELRRLQTPLLAYGNGDIPSQTTPLIPPNCSGSPAEVSPQITRSLKRPCVGVNCFKM